MSGEIVPIRSDLAPARWARGVPAHTPAPMRFTQTAQRREDIWASYGRAVQAQVDELIGELVEWWATSSRTTVVLGTGALVTVTPNPQVRGGYEIHSLQLDDRSFHREQIGERVAQQPGRAPNGTGAAADRIGTEMAGFLGNLPIRAQEFLQEPFQNDSGELWWDHYYRTEWSASGLGGAPLRVWCYLAGRRHVTFAHGVGYGYSEHRGATSWDLTCWRADVR